MLMASFVFIGSAITPVSAVLAADNDEKGLDPTKILSPDGAQKTKAEEEALMKGIITPFMSRSARATSTVVYKGQVSYGGSTVGHFELDGKQAFCIEHPKPTPPTGTPTDGGTPYMNPKVRATLYNGIGGEGNIFGADWTRGTVVTSLVVSEMYLGSYQGGKSIAGYTELKNKALAEDFPKTAASFSKKALNSTFNGKIQISDTVKLNADVRNKFSINLPEAVTFVNKTTGVKQKGGTVTFKGGDSFYLTAPANYNKNYASGVLKGSVKEYTPLLYVSNNPALQKLVRAVWRDPAVTISFSAHFEARTGSIEITKKGSDGKLLAGAEYDIKDSKGVLKAHVKTGANGKMKVNKLLQGNYTVTETKAPAGYTINKTPQKITVTAGQTAFMTFENKQVFFQIKLKKQDSETGDDSQGDATLVGAQYGIYADAATTKLLDEVTIGQDRTALSKKIALNGASRTVYVKETKAPTGYNMDQTIHTVKVDQTNDTTEVFLGNLTSKEDVIKGGFDLVKFANKPLLQSVMEGLPEGQKAPLLGAEFTVSLKSNPEKSYKMTTDKNGKAIISGLPYGTYVVSETKTPEGYNPVADFEVMITEQGQTFHYILEDKVIEAKVKIVKKDVETGKVIPVAGATFKVKDSEGNVVTQHLNYPSDEDMTEFVTTNDGTLVLPETLPFGEYTLEEVKAPQGYLLNKEPIPFTIDKASDGSMVTVEFSDAPAKGKIKGVKTKEVMDTEKSTASHVAYKDVPAANIHFDVVAKEDVTTPDGTIRAEKGKVVDQLVTDKEGQFESTKELYLGKYQLVETNQPAEYRDLAPVDVTLEYQDDQTEMVWVSKEIRNILKKGDAEISKKDVTGDDELPGAILHIKGKDVDLTWVSTSEAKRFTLPEGKYALTEKLPNDGYQLNTNTIYFEVKDGKVTKTVMHNKRIPAPKKTGHLPTTGDQALDMILLSVGVLLVAGASVYLVKRRRDAKQNEE